MANRYWVGGTSTWNNATTNWSATDGGASGATVPGAADTALFTALSGTVTVTWMSGVGATLLGITCTGFTGTHATGGFAKTLAGTGTVWNSPATCTITGAPNITVSSTGSTAITVTCFHASPSATNAPNFGFTGGTYALTIGGTGFRNIVFTGFAGSITGGANPTSYGSITLSTGGTFTAHGPTMAATGTFTSLGKTISGITVNAVGGTVTLADAMTAGITSSTILTAGTLALAGFTLSTGIFSSSGSSTRAISFGVGNIALTSTTAADIVLSMGIVTGFTWTGTGGFTRNQAATATVSFGITGGSTSNAPNLTVNAGASALTITTGSYFKAVIFTGSTSTVTASALNMAGNLTLASGGTYTSIIPIFLASATVTSAGKTLGNTTINGAGITVTLADAMIVGIANTTTLTAGTLDLAGFTLSTGVFSSNNSNTRAISFAAANIALTSTTAAVFVITMGTATGFTWTGTGGFTRNQAATAQMEFGSTGGSTTNAPNLTVNAGASALTILSGSYFKNVNFTGSTCGVSATLLNMAGNLTLASGGSYVNVSPTFRASGTFTSAGASIGSAIVNGSGITVTLADAMAMGTTSTLTLTQGTFTAANFNVTAGLFSSSNSNTRTLNMGSGTWTITGSGSLAWSTSATGFTLNPSTSTITMTSASSKTFTGGGLTYYNLNQGGAGTLSIGGSNTFNDITNTVQPATLSFTELSTQTVSNFSLSGTVGNLITIQSAFTPLQFTLSKSSGTINAQYLSIKYSNATGGAVWNARESTDAGGNTGWNIFAGGAMFLMFS